MLIFLQHLSFLVDDGMNHSKSKYVTIFVAILTLDLNSMGIFPCRISLTSLYSSLLVLT
jgi:hypothetical protein